ncbi:hypothetical protein CPC08DRAFT_627261 [Agrocybe pediades]|nr:hypothetical protein CPC08DRAFT_627261 [Agrocybe pediades]
MAGPLILPNPLTPMAFFPPTSAFEITITAYVMVASLAVMIWDVLHTIGPDYILLTRHKIRLPTVIYFISKLATLGWLLTVTLFSTAPVGHCELWEKAANWFNTICVPSTTFLFFFRVQAVYKDNKPIVGFFFLMWIGVCCAGVIGNMDFVGTQIGPTQYCVDSSIPKTTYLAGVALLVNDTLTFLAISWRLMDGTPGEKKSFRQRVRAIFFGTDLPTFSRAFLKDGQKYYLTTVGFSIFATITLSLEVVPFPYRGVIGIPDVMLLNVMACRVFRNTKLGLYRETPEAIASRVAKELGITVDNSRTGTFNNSTGNDDATAPTPLSGAQLLPFPRTSTTPASASTPYGAGNLSPNPFRQNPSTEDSLRMVPLARYPAHRYREPNPWRTVWYE